jgi:excisionase family DNA binding protein
MFTVAQAAGRLGISQSLLYAMVQEKKIPHRRVGVGKGRILFTDEDIGCYLESCRVQAFALPTAVTFTHTKTAHKN